MVCLLQNMEQRGIHQKGITMILKKEDIDKAVRIVYQIRQCLKEALPEPEIPRDEYSEALKNMQEYLYGLIGLADEPCTSFKEEN